MWAKQIFYSKSVCPTDNKKDKKMRFAIYQKLCDCHKSSDHNSSTFIYECWCQETIFSLGLSYYSSNNFRKGYICVHVNKTCVLELQLPRQHPLTHFYFIFYWAFTYEEGQKPFVHAQFIYSFFLSARLVKTCQWTFKGSIVMYKITPEGENKCCLRYWIVETEPIMQFLFGYIFRWLIRSSTNPWFESRRVWSLKSPEHKKINNF